MQKKINPEYWIPDTETYNQLQKLKQFVDFVAGLEYSTPEDKTKAEEIKLLIENIDKPETFLKEWLIALDIFDYDIQAGRGTGIYWKKWCVSFESGRLEIEAADEILDEQHFTETGPTYNGGIFFENDFIRICGYIVITAFVVQQFKMNFLSVFFLQDD